MGYTCAVGLAKEQRKNLNTMKGRWFAFALFFILRPQEADCRQRKGSTQVWRGQNAELERNTYSLFRSASGSYSEKARGKGKGASYSYKDDGIYYMKKRPKSKSKKEIRGMRGSSKSSKSSSTDWEHNHLSAQPDESSDYSEDPGSSNYPADTSPSIDPPSSVNTPFSVSPPPSMRTPDPPALLPQQLPPTSPTAPTGKKLRGEIAECVSVRLYSRFLTLNYI